MASHPHRASGRPQNPPPPAYSRNPGDVTVIRLPDSGVSSSLGCVWPSLLFAGLTALLCLAVMVLLGFYSYYRASDRILPGIQVGKTDLGGMSPSEAALLLDRSLNKEKKILVSNGSQSVLITPVDLGLQVDALETAKKAYAVGHEGTFLAASAEIFAAMKDGWQVPPVVSLDEEAARQRLQALAPLMSQPAKDATIRLEGTSLLPVPSGLGYTINLDETLATLVKNPQAVAATGVLPVTPQPVMPRLTDVTPALAQAQSLMDKPASIDAYDPISNEKLNLPVPHDVIGGWLRVAPGDNGPQITLDEAQLASYLAGLSPSLGNGRSLDASGASLTPAEAIRRGVPIPAIVRHQPTTYVVQSGDTLLKIGWKVGMPFWMIAKANPSINADALSTGMKLVVPSKDDLLPLPVVPNKRIVINITRQRLAVYQDGKQVSQHPISTGIDRSPTQPGVFQVQTHDKNAYASVWDLYMPNFLGIYEAWPGFMNGIHGLPMLSNGTRLWANVLGKPASYGCIILDLQSAAWLYDWAENGVVVEIQP